MLATVWNLFLMHCFDHFSLVATQRPVEIKLVNNSECEQPRVTLMRDTILKQFEQDAVVPFAKVPEAIKERNAKSPIPIRIQYEFKYCWGMTFYDTPGLLPNTSSSAVPFVSFKLLYCRKSRKQNL